MSEINLISVTNLTQMDRHQSDTHRAPVVHQEQNAQLTQDELMRRMSMPVEPDTIEKKKIGPDEKRKDRDERRKKRLKAIAQTEQQPPVSGDSLIDLRA
jgi:hypothetical protein